jgi:Flp pilus assembly secretin CpaC
MKRHTATLAAALLVAAGAALILGDRAGAEERDAPAPQGVWAFDVRIVRVDPPSKDGAEAPAPFASMTGTTMKTTWRDALALLKQRGATTILMDNNVTTLDGEKATAASDRTVPILAVNFANKADEQLRATNVNTGCKLEVTPGGEVLRYGVRVQWTLGPAAGSEPPEQFVAEWNGSHPRLDGDTLVLTYREQVPHGKDGAVRAVEIYALLTGRFVARR